MDQFSRKILSTLIKLDGCAIGSITTETKVDLLGGKKNPMKGRIKKFAEGGNVMFFTNSKDSAYRKMVCKRLAKEGKNPASFSLSPRVWGERIPETPFIQHKGKFYLEAIFLSSPKSIKYFLDGEEIAKENIEGLKPASAKTGQGGLEDQVVIRSYKLESIKNIQMGGLSVSA